VTKRVSPGYARYIGRIGGLAVALGISAAIGQGVASADSGESTDTAHSVSDAGKRVVSEAHKATKDVTTQVSNNLKTIAKKVVSDTQGALDRASERIPTTLRAANTSTKIQGLAGDPVATAQKVLETRLRNAPRNIAREIQPQDLAGDTLATAQKVLQTQLRNAPHNIAHEVRNTVTGTVPAVVNNWATRVGLPGLPQPTPAPSPSTPVADDVLKTDDQLAAEKDVTMITSTLIVEAAKYPLKALWYAQAMINYAQLGGPDKLNMDQLDQAVDEFANQAAVESMLLNPNDPKLLLQVMPPHVWSDGNGGFISGPGTRIWYDNPDTTYRFSGVNASSEYVIRGKYTPGAEPTDTNFSVLTGLAGTTADNLSWEQIQKNEDDGTFAITIGSDPTKKGTPNYLYMPPDATLVTTRNTRSDAMTQDNMELTIDRTSGPPNSLFSQLGGFVIPGLGAAVAQNETLVKLVSAVPPVHLPLVVRAGETALLMMVMGVTRENDYMQVATVDPETGEQRAPNSFTDPQYNAQFLATQRQSSGYFQLADDEVLVLHIEPNGADYFIAPVTNVWTITGHRPSSKNMSQLTQNADGSYDVYVSKNDPGTGNWVSTGGLSQGTMAIRFQKVPEGGQPKVSSTVVTASSLQTSV